MAEGDVKVGVAAGEAKGRGWRLEPWRAILSCEGGRRAAWTGWGGLGGTSAPFRGMVRHNAGNESSAGAGGAPAAVRRRYFPVKTGRREPEAVWWVQVVGSNDPQLSCASCD